MATARKKSAQFVKSAASDVSVEKSIEDIKTLVRRHGAAGFGVQEDYRTGRVIVSFVLNTENGGHLPLQIPMDVNTVYDRMYSTKAAANQHMDAGQVAENRRAQAERTAWRQLHLIIDALLVATSLGIMTLSDAFMGHIVVVHDDGKSERMGDYLARTQGALAAGVRALLPSGSANE